MKGKESRRKFSWVTEWLMECSCDKSPHYSSAIRKITHKDYICPNCDTSKDNWVYMHRSNTHYIKLPRPMTVKNIRKWTKKNKALFKGRDSLMNQEKMNETTYTTKAQVNWEKRKKVKCRAKELWTSPAGVKVRWYGKTPTLKQIPHPTKDMEVNIGQVKQTLKFANKETRFQITYKKGKVGDLRDVAELEMNNPSLMGKVMFSTHNCNQCNKTTSLARTTPVTNKKLCPDCYKIIQERNRLVNHVKEKARELNEQT